MIMITAEREECTSKKKDGTKKVKKALGYFLLAVFYAIIIAFFCNLCGWIMTLKAFSVGAVMTALFFTALWLIRG